MRRPVPKLCPLAAGLALAGFASQAAALSFEMGPFEGTFTSTLTVGASWRLEDPDSDVVTPGNTAGKGGAASSTADDGNLNYEKGDMYSLLFKGVHDLDLNAGNYGFFTRFKYWYDYALDDDKLAHGSAANDYVPNQTLETGDFEDLAKEKGFEFLDYYAYANFDLGSLPVEVRGGNMVLSWGESTFIQNGVNTINPFDVTALRQPGSEIKEALLPVGMVYANVGLTYDLSLEAFYQYEWQRTIIDECGTYWSSTDPYGGGCDYLTATAGVSDREQFETGYVIPRAPDQEASDSGQWGVAMRYFVDSLNSTEFGLYYTNLHNRTPIFSGINPSENYGVPFLLGSNPYYFFEYPEDIELYGLTFATNIGEWAVSGELSYRPEFPLQINTVDLLQSLALGSWGEWSRVTPRATEAGAGAVVHGYDEVEYTQFQMTFIKFFEQVLGASRLSFAAEAAGTWIGGMDDDINYGRSSAYGIGDFEEFQSTLFNVPVSCNSHPFLEAVAGLKPNSNGDYCTDDGFTDDFSWGYRVRASLEYPSAIAGINLTPSLAWGHDVSGTSPSPNFIDGRKALSLALRGDYLNTYRAELSYTTYFGADYNEQEDRDFLSLSFSVAF
ncbi:DUF1302 domain-containing protein [Mangrovimicrobium sediminis]|uniref:DUF1302 domain-containing protein n=1 Tax=Mangrovimicrobium sediminis TaxID=2562682 RepID=A0A4Z0M9A2_9GAMM|nr:DUF1302 domain-containing protein [Haliea sp. SAOS-164]TGD76064.1 DUF1302 domain-containing protein [Haliea sp. SAOS-164]